MQPIKIEPKANCVLQMKFFAYAFAYKKFHMLNIEPFVSKTIIKSVQFRLVIIQENKQKMWTIYLLIFLVLLFALKEIVRLFQLDWSTRHLPTLPSKFLIGHYHHVAATNSKDFFNKFFKITMQIDKTFKMWFGPICLVTVQDRDDVKTIFNQCLEKPFIYKYLPEMAHTSMFMVEGTYLRISIN